MTYCSYRFIYRRPAIVATGYKISAWAVFGKSFLDCCVKFANHCKDVKVLEVKLQEKPNGRNVNKIFIDDPITREAEQ